MNNVTAKWSKNLVLSFLAVFILSGAARAAGSDNSSQFVPGMTFVENLKAFTGKAVTVSLSSGQTYTGTVKEVKNGLLHLEKLSQKEFFDVLIVLDTISAVEARVR